MVAKYNFNYLEFLIIGSSTHLLTIGIRRPIVNSNVVTTRIEIFFGLLLIIFSFRPRSALQPKSLISTLVLFSRVTLNFDAWPRTWPRYCRVSQYTKYLCWRLLSSRVIVWHTEWTDCSTWITKVSTRRRRKAIHLESRRYLETTPTAVSVVKQLRYRYDTKYLSHPKEFTGSVAAGERNRKRTEKRRRNKNRLRVQMTCMLRCWILTQSYRSWRCTRITLNGDDDEFSSD